MCNCIVCGLEFENWLELANHAEVHYFDGTLLASLPDPLTGDV